MDARDSIESPAMTETNPDPKASPQTGAVAGPTISVAPQAHSGPKGRRDVGTVELQGLHAYYGSTHAVRGVDLGFAADKVTAIIGPSGCGKSTMVRCINRMHEEIDGARAEGQVMLDGLDLYDSRIDIVARAFYARSRKRMGA